MTYLLTQDSLLAEMVLDWRLATLVGVTILVRTSYCTLV